MLKPTTTLLALTAAVALLAAHAPAQESHFTGVVVTDRVNLRSGAGEQYYPVGTLSSGDLVKARKNIAGWLEVEPPAGSFSYVDKQYVQPAADGKGGVVTENRTRVRAPSSAGPRESFKTQVTLDKGTAVKILGEEGDFYKIASPEGVSLYVHQDFVKPATPEQLAALSKKGATAVTQVKPAAVVVEPVKPKAEPAKPAVVVESAKPQAAKEPVEKEVPGVLKAVVLADGTVYVGGKSLSRDGFVERIDKALTENPDLRVELRGSRQARYEDVKETMDLVTGAGVKNIEFVREEAVAAEVPKAPEEPAPVAPVEKTPVTEKPAEAPVAAPPRLEEVELRFNDASKKPIAEQPLDELRMEYEKLLTETLSNPDKAKVKARLAVIETRREIKMSLNDVGSLKKEIETSRQTRVESEARKPKTYISVGRLVTSTLYTGDRLPLLYRIVDNANGLTSAYVRPSPTQDHALLVGQYVGVVGEKEYDPSLKLNVVRTKEIDVLEPKKAE